MADIDPDDIPASANLELVMPFVVCRSRGGPYDDDSLVAGYQLARVDTALELLNVVNGNEFRTTVRTALAAQLDLVAMRHGFTLYIEDVGGVFAGWSYATFRRST